MPQGGRVNLVRRGVKIDPAPGHAGTSQRARGFLAVPVVRSARRAAVRGRRRLLVPLLSDRGHGRRVEAQYPSPRYGAWATRQARQREQEKTQAELTELMHRSRPLTMTPPCSGRRGNDGVGARPELR